MFRQQAGYHTTPGIANLCQDVILRYNKYVPNARINLFSAIYSCIRDIEKQLLAVRKNSGYVVFATYCTQWPSARTGPLKSRHFPHAVSFAGGIYSPQLPQEFPGTVDWST